MHTASRPLIHPPNREAALLAESANWIAPENLEAAVQRALDNPQPLPGNWS